MMLQRQLNLSEPQIQDILYIRRLYHTRRGMLQAQRQAHISKICANKSVHPHQDFGHLADLADGLKAAALQDCKLYHNVGHALAWGVSALPNAVVRHASMCCKKLLSHFVQDLSCLLHTAFTACRVKQS